MGLLDEEFSEVPKKPSRNVLQRQASELLGKKKRKPRRGRGLRKKEKKQKEHERLMELYRKQKHERWKMFKEFERLIQE